LVLMMVCKSQLMRMLRTKLEKAVEMNLLSKDFVKSLDFKEDAVLFSDKDNKIHIAKNYTKWVFGEIDRMEIVEIDLDEKTVRVLERKHET